MCGAHYVSFELRMETKVLPVHNLLYEILRGLHSITSLRAKVSVPLPHETRNVLETLKLRNFELTSAFKPCLHLTQWWAPASTLVTLEWLKGRAASVVCVLLPNFKSLTHAPEKVRMCPFWRRRWLWLGWPVGCARTTTGLRLTRTAFQLTGAREM